MPVRIRGRRKNGWGYERLDYLPVSLLNVGLSEEQVARPPTAPAAVDVAGVGGALFNEAGAVGGVLQGARAGLCHSTRPGRVSVAAVGGVSAALGAVGEPSRLHAGRC